MNSSRCYRCCGLPAAHAPALWFMLLTLTRRHEAAPGPLAGRGHEARTWTIPEMQERAKGSGRNYRVPGSELSELSEGEIV